MLLTYFLMNQKHGSGTEENPDVGPDVSWYKAILLNKERSFEAIADLEDEWQAWAGSARSSEVCPVFARFMDEIPLLGSRFISTDERLAEESRHVVAQATNMVDIGVLGERADVLS